MNGASSGGLTVSGEVHRGLQICPHARHTTRAPEHDLLTARYPEVSAIEHTSQLPATDWVDCQAPNYSSRS